jgi:predicted dehydrogenase
VTDLLNVVLVGAGRAGMVHGRNLCGRVKGARLAAIADPSTEALERAGRELGCNQLIEDPVAAVTDDRIDAAVIAGPTFSHASVAVAALGADKHVLCEKPLASTADEASEMLAAERASNASFSMAFMRRFDDRFMRAAERIASGEIGEPLLVRSSGRGPGLPPEWAWDPRRSGGLVAEVNSHDLDTVRWLSGQEFVSVHAFGRAAKRPDIADRYEAFVDVIVASFELTAGLAQLDGACPADYGYDARVEVYGTEGTLLVGGPVADTAVVVRRDGVVTDPVRSWQGLFHEAYEREDQHFVRVARGEAQPRTTAEDGIRALEGVFAVNLSIAETRVVSLDEVAVG